MGYPINTNAEPVNQAGIGLNAPVDRTPKSRSKLSAEENHQLELIRLAKEYIAQGKAARAQFDSDWQKRLEYYRGDQWHKQRASYKTKPVLNIVRSTIQTVLPILTDARPGFNVIPGEPSDFKFAQVLSELCGAWWDRTSMDHTLIECLMDTMIYDAGILKVTWDPELEEGQGDIRVEVVDPNDIYVPYGARDFNKNCPWVCHKSKKTLGELKRLFPDHADEIRADNTDDNRTDYKRDTDYVHVVSPVDRKSTQDTDPASKVGDLRKTCDVCEIWMDSDEVEEVDMVDPDSGESKKVVKKKYPRGKVVTILINQNLVLQEIENPYEHAQKPFVRLINTILARSFWGEGEAKPLMQLQDVLNRALANHLDYSFLMANPTWIVGQETGINPKRISNSWASVLNPRPGTSGAISRDVPSSQQPAAGDLVFQIIRMAEMMSGVHDVTQGRRPEGVTAAAAIETLQEAAQTRIRLKERNLQVSLSQLGKQVIQLMLQYYREVRVSKVVGDEASKAWPDYYEFFIENDEQNVKYRLNTKQWTWSTEERKYVPQPQYKTEESKGIFDVKVLSGTAMPFAKAQRATIAFRLFDAQAIDQEELLKALEWPNAEQVLERMKAPPEEIAGVPGSPGGLPRGPSPAA